MHYTLPVAVTIAINFPWLWFVHSIVLWQMMAFSSYIKCSPQRLFVLTLSGIQMKSIPIKRQVYRLRYFGGMEHGVPCPGDLLLSLRGFVEGCQIDSLECSDLNSPPPPLDKMTCISQTIFSDAFSWMKSFVFWLKFHWSLFLRVQLTITQHWFR